MTYFTAFKSCSVMVSNLLFSQPTEFLIPLYIFYPIISTWFFIDSSSLVKMSALLSVFLNIAVIRSEVPILFTRTPLMSQCVWHSAVLPWWWLFAWLWLYGMAGRRSVFPSARSKVHCGGNWSPGCRMTMAVSEPLNGGLRPGITPEAVMEMSHHPHSWPAGRHRMKM